MSAMFAIQKKQETCFLYVYELTKKFTGSPCFTFYERKCLNGRSVHRHVSGGTCARDYGIDRHLGVAFLIN